jgi:5-oxoprolinase (ATP-hydrolysing) subunit C
MIEILDPPGHATLQDMGRQGHRRIGVGSSGAMDRLALATGNLMLGNAADAAAIEAPGVPMRLRFLVDTAFAITGADMTATLTGYAIPANWRTLARAGDELELRHARRGVYGYVSVPGGIDVPVVLGSRSTHLRGVFGGFDGRMLRPGDTLPTGRIDAGPASFGMMAPDDALPLPEAPDGATPVRVLPAAEYDCYDAPTQVAIWSTPWRISSQSNRAGYRLAGPNLTLARPIEMRSHGLVPGVIQGPAGGQPIIQLADAYTAGGYPKIGVVIEPDLWRIAQTPLGGSLRFVRCSHAEALAAQDAFDAHLDRTRQWVNLAGVPQFASAKAA